MAKYSESSIQVLEGLEAVRKKPGLYVGTTDQKGIFQCIKEALDNSTDEAANGYGKRIECVIDTKSQTITVLDQGRGIPVGIHAKTKISTLTTVLTVLHAGGKIEKNKNYKQSAGTFGVGISVTNALSESLSVWTVRDGKCYFQKFRKGKPTTAVIKAKPPFELSQGTAVQFKPDFSILNGKIPVNSIRDLMSHLSYFHPIKFILSIDGKKTIFFHKNGAKDFVEARLQEIKAEKIGQPIFLKTKNLTFIGQWTDYEEEDLKTYVNGSLTLLGGTHYNALGKVISDAFAPLKKKKHNFKPADLRIGLIGFLTVNISSPEFNSQTKEKLTSKDAGELVLKELAAPMKKFVSSNKSFANTILEKASEMRSVFQDFALSKKNAAKLKTKKKGKIYLPEKLAVSTTNNPQERELFLVEGESAGGKAKVARNKEYQEVLSLKGKILNVYKATPEKIGNSNEIIDILQSIGYQPNLKDPFSTLRVGRIIFMTDSDEDGRHIALLLSGLFQKVLAPLIEKGKVFTLNAPLFTTQIKGKKIYADTLKALQKKAKTEKLVVTRLKGWGEASIDMLSDLAFDPKTRSVTQLKPPNKSDLRKFKEILSAESDARKLILGLSQ